MELAAKPIRSDPSTWSPGTLVRLAAPDNAHHPRAGRTGAVLRTKWFADFERRGKVVSPACWMVEVRFAPEGDTWGADWLLFAHELRLAGGGE